MVLDGATVVSKNYVTFPDALFDTEEQIQPNGVDLRLERVLYVQGKPTLPADGRIDVDNVQITEQEPCKEGWFELTETVGNYLVDFRESISVPDGYCAIIVTRSSLVRCGVDVFTGLWDTGYQGRLGGSLRLRNPISLQYGARLGQVMFHKSAFNGHRYAGLYQGLKSTDIR